MKGLLCVSCVDFRALSTEGPVECRCGNVQGWWLDAARGIAQFHAYDRSTAYGMGVHNGYLTGAHALQGAGMGEDWRSLHDHVTAAPGYLFDTSRRGCWALIFKPGVTSDTSWADDRSGGSA